MIRFCTYLLLVALTLQSFYRSIMTVEYQLHLPDYIAQCINKDKPQLHCDGQCVLMQKIKEKEKANSKMNLVVYEYSSHYVHKEHTIFTPFHQEVEIIRNTFTPYLIDYRFTFNNSVIRPPIA